MRTLTASERSTLIKLASNLPKGSSERRAILASLKKTLAYTIYKRITTGAVKTEALAGLKAEAKGRRVYGESPMTLQEAYENLAGSLTRTLGRHKVKAKAVVVQMITDAVVAEGGVISAANKTHLLTLEVEGDVLTLAGKFDGDDYYDPDPYDPDPYNYVEVPSDEHLHRYEIRKAIKKLGGKIDWLNYDLASHPNDEDRGQILYNLRVGFPFDEVAVAKTLFRAKDVKVAIKA